MEAHNSKTRLGTSEVPLVVKFADAKRKEPSPHHVSYIPLPVLMSMSACKHLGMALHLSCLRAAFPQSEAAASAHA